jgi:hypothetical protein
VKSSKDLQLSAAQQKLSQTERSSSRSESEILEPSKAKELMQITHAEEKIMELEKDRERLEWRFVLHCN